MGESSCPGKGRLKALPGGDPGQDWLSHNLSGLS
jgi:hypothetical protein